MADLRTLERVLKALANKRRLQILQLLKKSKGATVGEIRKTLRITMPAVSRHLSLLEAAGIVKQIKRGKHVFYRLSLNQIAPVAKVLSTL